MPQNWENLVHLSKWLKMVNMRHTRKNGSKWQKCNALIKVAQNGPNIAKL